MDDVRHDVSTVHLLHMSISQGQSAYRRTRASRSYQQRPEYLPQDQSVKKLSTKARVPTGGPEHQEVINKGQSAYRRTRASRSYQQRPGCLPKDQSVKKLSTKARAPTEEPERQDVINKGQSFYRRTRASRSYQQRPKHLPKDQSVKKLSAAARAPQWSGQQTKRQDGNHTRIGRSYAMAVPINVSSHGEVGDLAEKR